MQYSVHPSTIIMGLKEHRAAIADQYEKAQRKVASLAEELELCDDMISSLCAANKSAPLTASTPTATQPVPAGSSKTGRGERSGITAAVLEAVRTFAPTALTVGQITTTIGTDWPWEAKQTHNHVRQILYALQNKGLVKSAKVANGATVWTSVN